MSRSRLRGLLIRANRSRRGEDAGPRPPDPDDGDWLGEQLQLLRELVQPQVEAAVRQLHPRATVTLGHGAIGVPDVDDKRGRIKRQRVWIFKLRRAGADGPPDEELCWPWDADPATMLQELDGRLRRIGW